MYPKSALVDKSYRGETKEGNAYSLTWAVQKRIPDYSIRLRLQGQLTVADPSTGVLKTISRIVETIEFKGVDILHQSNTSVYPAWLRQDIQDDNDPQLHAAVEQIRRGNIGNLLMQASQQEIGWY